MDDLIPNRSNNEVYSWENIGCPDPTDASNSPGRSNAAPSKKDSMTRVFVIRSAMA